MLQADKTKYMYIYRKNTAWKGSNNIIYLSPSNSLVPCQRLSISFQEGFVTYQWQQLTSLGKGKCTQLLPCIGPILLQWLLCTASMCGKRKRLPLVHMNHLVHLIVERHPHSAYSLVWIYRGMIIFIFYVCSKRDKSKCPFYASSLIFQSFLLPSLQDDFHSSGNCPCSNVTVTLLDVSLLSRQPLVDR